MTEEETKKLGVIFQRRADVMHEKIARAKGMLKCASSYLLPSGVFGACGGCGNSKLCYSIQRAVAKDIQKAYDLVR